jgi:hypothetical protein
LRPGQCHDPGAEGILLGKRLVVAGFGFAGYAGFALGVTFILGVNAEHSLNKAGPAFDKRRSGVPGFVVCSCDVKCYLAIGLNACL